MIEKLEEFYLEKEEPNKSCLLTLRDIILQNNPTVSECIKYGMPCFCVGKKAICYLWTDKETAEPYILFVEGKHLNHPDLEQGNRARMKILRVNPMKDIPLNIIKDLFKEAVTLV